MSPQILFNRRRPALSTLFLRLFFLFQFVLCVIPSPAQQTLADADWFERELGAGVVWRYYLFDSLYGSKQSVSYIEVDLANPAVDIEFPYLASTRQRTSTMAPAQFPQAVGAVNGTYFDTEGTGGHRTYLRVDGTVIPPGGTLFSPWGYEGALALTASGTASMPQMPTGGWVNDVTHPSIMACGPLVVIGGVIPSAALTAIGSHCTGRNPRSAVGLTPDNRLMLVTVDGRTDLAAGMTCEELGQLMDELGCDEALNLDGGGSTTLWGAGEPYNGVLNYPSDNGQYDHEGERACSNAIAITSTPPNPKTWDARLTGKAFTGFVDNGASQTVTLNYQNIGTGTWTAADTKVVLARPETRTSVFQHATWTSASQPALMSPSTVAPGETATFTFVMQAPVVSITSLYNEHFMLTRTGVGRIGPADSEAWMRIIVQPPVAPGVSFIVESRAGGQNFGWYSDSGFADSGANCTATSCTGTIGTRYGSTYRSVAGRKRAVAAPNFPEPAYYNVYVAWPGGSSRRSPITYHVTDSSTTYTVDIDQTVTSNTWVRLGTKPFYFEEGYSGAVIMTNENIDVSGSMYAGAVKFEYVPAEASDKTYEVQYLGPAASKPVINGTAAAGEWNAASPAGTGYVRHDNPLTAAAEDGAFRILCDDSYLYFLFQMSDEYLAGFAPPPASYDYFDLAGDKIELFLTPLGPHSQRFYRLVFAPNPTNATCYVWSQASMAKTTSATVGIEWEMRGGAAYNYAGNALTVEYRILWSAFDYAGIEALFCPVDGQTWGIQPCISNQLAPASWEYVNWEPDAIGSYVFGEPYGTLRFTRGTSRVEEWSLY